MIPENKDNSLGRMTRGEKIAKEKTILENTDGTFSVPSQTVEEIAYLVRLIDNKYICNCLDFKYNHVEACKHVHAVKFWIAAQVEINQKPKLKVFAEDSIQCSKCGSIRVWKFGISDGKQIYKCKDCKTKFRYSLLKKARYSPETVSLCLDLYFSGTSLAKTARILNNQFGTSLTKVTVYRWIKKLIPRISEYVNSLSPQLSDTWHTDEVFVPMKDGIAYGKVNKKGSWKVAFLWNVMDRKTRFLLSSKLAPFRDTIGANNALEEACKVAKDQLPSYLYCDNAGAYRNQKLAKIEGLENLKIIKRAGINKPHSNNNRIERLNGTLRERIKVQRGWKKIGTPIAEGMKIHYNFVKPHMELEGMTPAQRAGIGLYSKNKWLELLEASVKGENDITA